MLSLPTVFKKMPGEFGDYVQLTRGRGIKLIGREFKTAEDAYCSDNFAEAKEEADLLREAQASKVVPKCYGVRVIRHGKHFRVGILMQHLGKKRVSDMNINEDEFNQIRARLWEKLFDSGIEHNDLHDKNVMFYRKKFYAIDFSPDCIMRSGD